MKCTVIRSNLKDFTYIYLSDDTQFEDLPNSLQKVFGEPELVMTLELTPERKLAYENTEQVMKNLTEKGFHLQMPLTNDPTGLLDLPEKKETLL
jgi:uncharacterized protein YcgL (UPF0745 family)